MSGQYNYEFHLSCLVGTSERCLALRFGDRYHDVL